MSEANEGWGDDAGYGLAEAQIAAIEQAFAERDRMLARLDREMAELRTPQSPDAATPEIEARLAAVEDRLDEQERALRHVLERLIAFFEREG